MKVFISFDTIDSQLAYTLKNILKEKGIEGYLFDLEQKYNSTLYDKITSAINDSQVLVAIITKNMNSPSVHEEIGYAIGSQKSVIIMLEEGATDGVLSHEREKEIFTKDIFEISCKKISNYLETQVPTSFINESTNSSESFLEERNIANKNSDDFGKNVNSKKLETPLKDSSATKKPLVLFSACPINLLEDIPVTTKPFDEWLSKFNILKLNEQQLVFLNGSKKIDLDTIAYFYPHASKYFRYLEINSNGFLEQGFTKPLIYSVNTETSKKPFLHLCWLTGSFWAFLIFCKEFYKHIQYTKEFDIFLSIRHTDELMLMGFGGNTGENRYWSEPFNDFDWMSDKPHTEKNNLQIKKTIKLNLLNDEKITELVREFSNKIANAYGLEFAMCYNDDGTINAKLLNSFNGK